MNMRRATARAGTWLGVLLLLAAVGSLTAEILTGARARTVNGAGASQPVAKRTAPAAVRPTATITPSAARRQSVRPGPRKPDPHAALTRTLAALPKGSASVAALDLGTGARFAGGDLAGHWTASVYKPLVLHILWLQTHGALTATERADAVAAIENSDNKAGYRLFLDIGGNAGLRAGIRRLHMTHTVPGLTDPTFTTTSAADCVTALRAVLGDPYTLTLMRHVASDQRWGIGAAGEEVAIKNGWLSVDDSNGSGEDDGGRWIVNSIGVVSARGHTVLLAVLTQHNPDLGSGIALVERLARQAAAAVAS